MRLKRQNSTVLRPEAETAFRQMRFKNRAFVQWTLYNPVRLKKTGRVRGAWLQEAEAANRLRRSDIQSLRSTNAFRQRAANSAGVCAKDNMFRIKLRLFRYLQGNDGRPVDKASRTDVESRSGGALPFCFS
jgi:hypothetical protein